MTEPSTANSAEETPAAAAPSGRCWLDRFTALWSLLLAFLSVAPIFKNPFAFATSYDYRYFETWIEAGRRSILWYHEFPLWNPWTCGGQVYLANPQSLVTAPVFIFPLVAGTALGLKLIVLFYMFCAIDGMYRLARDFGLDPVGAFFAAAVFGTGGWFALHYSEGHLTFTGAALFPYMILCYRRGLSHWEWVIPLGALAAWVVAMGGTTTPPMAGVFLMIFAVIDVVRRRSLRPFVVLLAAGASAGLVGAIRVLPAMQFALDHPRHLFETDANYIWEIFRNGYWWKGIEPIGSPDGFLKPYFPSKRYWFHEYGWRLPYITPIFIGWSLVDKKHRWLWIVAAFGAAIVAGSARIDWFWIVLIALGGVGAFVGFKSKRNTLAVLSVVAILFSVLAMAFFPAGPWGLLKHLPLFRQLRVPSRYSYFLAFAFPLLCGAALDHLIAKYGKLKTLLVYVVPAIAILDGLAFDWWCYQKTFASDLHLAKEGDRFYQLRGTWQIMVNNVLDNHGAIGCDEEAPLQRALKLDEGDVPQARLDDDSAGQIKSIVWTPNRMIVSVELSKPATLLPNHNWNEHWKTTVGEVVRFGEKVQMDKDGGRLGIKLLEGQHEVQVYYQPRSFVIGSAVSALSIPAAFALFFVMRRRRKGA